MATITDNDLKIFQERARTELAAGCDVGSIAWDSVIWDLCNEVRRLRGVPKERGNAAKLRDALSAALDMIFDLQNCHMSPIANRVYAVRRKIKDALAAPARNCDRFANAVEAMAELKRVHSYCAKENRRCLEDCPDCGKEWCSLAWLFAPATESEA